MNHTATGFDEAFSFHHLMELFVPLKLSSFPSGCWRLAERSEDARVGASRDTWFLSINRESQDPPEVEATESCLLRQSVGTV